MDTLIILLVGYVILKSIFSGGDYDKKPERRKRSRKSSFWGRRSHIFRLRHVESLAWG